MRTTKAQIRLICAFVVRCQDSIIPLVSISKISSFLVASVVAQTGLSHPGCKPEDRFSRDVTYAKCRRDPMKALSGVDYGIHALVSVIIQPSYP